MPLPAARMTAAETGSDGPGERDDEAGDCIQGESRTKRSGFRQLARQDSNLDKQYQKLLCYRYTTGQLPEVGASMSPRRAVVLTGSFVRPRKIRWEPGRSGAAPPVKTGCEPRRNERERSRCRDGTPHVVQTNERPHHGSGKKIIVNGPVGPSTQSTSDRCGEARGGRLLGPKQL